MTTDTEGLIERVAEAIIRGRYEMVERGDWPVEHARTFGTYVWRGAKQDARSAIAALQQPDERDAKIARRLESAEFALAYLASCTAATVENMLDRKSTPKSELSRHESILGMLDKAMRGERLKTHYSSTAIIEAEPRVKKALERVRIALQRNRKEP